MNAKATQAKKRKPLRLPPEPGVDTANWLWLLGGRYGHWVDYDWKQWRPVVRGLTKAVRDRGFTGRIPRCRNADPDTWLEELNFLIGRKENFVDGKSYELIDLEAGSDVYCILLCRKGYRIPKRALWSQEKEEERDLEAAISFNLVCDNGGTLGALIWPPNAGR